MISQKQKLLLALIARKHQRITEMKRIDDNMQIPGHYGLNFATTRRQRNYVIAATLNLITGRLKAKTEYQ